MSSPSRRTRRGRRLPILGSVALVVSATVQLSAVDAWAAGPLGSPCAMPHPWCDTRLSPDARADLLLGAMTLDEEISLLGGEDPAGVIGGDGKHTGTGTGIPRLDVPTVYYSDGPQGPRQGKSSGLPSPLSLAATFSRDLAGQYGRTVATEVKLKGNDTVFGPAMDLMRNPQNGRTFESFGEDPYLSARTAVPWVRAAQSTGVMANVKHFAANNQEGSAGPAANALRPGVPLGVALVGSRTTEDSVVHERTLHELYYPSYEAAVREGKAASVMCAYPRVNGTYACQNTELLQRTLRDQWGFKGYVLSDYLAAKDPAASLKAGLDFEPFPGTGYSPPVVRAALASGQVTEAMIGASVRRQLRTLFAYGVFDRPAYTDDDRRIPVRAHQAISQDIAERSMVLLRNTGRTLPLRADGLKRLAVIGAPADDFLTGGGSGNIEPYSTTTILQGLQQRVGSRVTVTFDDGSDPAAAAVNAAAADVAVVVASQYQTEGTDNFCLTLECPTVYGDQDGLISTVAAAQPRTAVVLATGGPVLTPWREDVQAIVQAWYPGSQGGKAVARVLFGDVDPGGRLPATFPASEDQPPTAGDPGRYPGIAEQVTYSEGVFVGYRWYDQQRLAPAYPFGYGQSYTTFSYGPLTLRRSGSGAVASVRVTNTGTRTGTAVPQLYAALPARTGVPQPPRQLRGYESLSLAPAASRTVDFPLRARDLAYFDAQREVWTVAPGCYGLEAGASSRALPSRAVLAVGTSCAGSALRIATPSSAAADQVALSTAAAGPAERPAAPSPAAAAPGSTGALPATGPAPLLPTTGVLVLVLALLVRRPVRRDRVAAAVVGR